MISALATMKQFAALLALAVLCGTTQAKCLDLIYTFEGLVIGKFGAPAVGALVGVSWLESGQAAGPAIAVTDGNGRYRVSVRFSPGNDVPLLMGATCTDRLERISIVAHNGAQRSHPAQVPISSLNQKLPSVKIDEPAGNP